MISFMSPHRIYVRLPLPDPFMCQGSNTPSFPIYLPENVENMTKNKLFNAIEVANYNNMGQDLIELWHNNRHNHEIKQILRRSGKCDNMCADQDNLIEKVSEIIEFTIETKFTN